MVTYFFRGDWLESKSLSYRHYSVIGCCHRYIYKSMAVRYFQREKHWGKSYLSAHSLSE